MGTIFVSKMLKRLRRLSRLRRCARLNTSHYLFLGAEGGELIRGTYILVQHRNVNILYQNVSDKSIVNLNRFDLMEPNETDRLE